jgi:hypothetical protein
MVIDLDEIKSNPYFIRDKFFNVISGFSMYAANKLAAFFFVLVTMELLYSYSL